MNARLFNDKGPGVSKILCLIFICVACRRIVDGAEGFVFRSEVRADGRSRSRSSEVTAIVTFSFSAFFCLTPISPIPLHHRQPHPRPEHWMSTCPREFRTTQRLRFKSLMCARKIFFSQAVSSLGVLPASISLPRPFTCARWFSPPSGEI